MPGNSATVSIAIEVDDKGSVKIRQLGEAARKAGDEGARGFDAMGKSATGAERGINTMSTSLKALGGLAAAVAASAVVSKLVEIGRSAIQAASDMEQTQQKFDVVFRGMSSQAEAWATVLRDSFAMSALEAKNYMASIQNMLVPTGMAREEAGKLSFELTKLASDLASFNNKTTTQAFEDIMSALQGSSETMDKYGINVRESLVQQEAFTLGLARSKDEISQADRMLATYSLMIKQAGDAIGDTERSMLQAELQQRLLHARIEDFRVFLGQQLLPVVNEMITGINNWMRENEGVLKQDLAAWAEIAAGALRGLMAVVHTLAEAYRGLKEAIVAVGTAEMNSGPAMMAEAAAQGVDKLVSNVNKVPGALANIKKAEEEIARIQANIAKQGFASEQQTAAVERLKGQVEGYRATIAAAEAPTTNTAAAVKVLDGSSKQAVASADELARAAAGAAGAIDTKGASSAAATSAAKAEREAIAQVAVAMRNYAHAAEPGTRATEEWAKGATDAAEAMADLSEHYATAGLSEYDALMVELNREFAEGQAAIRAYDAAMAEANAKVGTASRELEAAEAQLAEYRRQLEATSLSGEELQAKLGAAAGAVEKKRAALDAARSAAAELEAANGGVIATEEDLRKRIFETNESLEQQRQRYIDTALAGDSFFTGVAAGMLDMQDSMMTLGRVGYEVFNELREGWRDSFFAVMSGDLDDLGDIWDSTLQAMLRAFSDFLADLVMAWAAAGIADMFGFQIPGLGGSVTSGWGDSITSLIGGGSSVALSQYGPYASGYATGGGAAAGVTGAQAAGSALGVAGGAYGLYNAAGQVASGNANAGTALQAGISAYSIYKGYPAVAAYLSSLGSTAATGTAAAAYTGAGSLAYGQTGSVVMNAMLAEKMGTAAGSAIVAETAAAGTTAAAGSTATAGTTAAAGGSAGAGLSTGAMVGGGAIMGIGALIAMGMGGKAQQEFYSPRYGNVPFRDYGHDDRQDMIRAGRSGYNWVSEAQPGSSSGSGDAAVTQTMADLERAFKQFESNTRIVLDVLAAAGDGVASLGQQLEDGTLSTDAFVDAIAGYDVSIQETATLTGLASEAARGNGNSMDALRAALQSMGLGADQAEIAALALVAASNNQATSLYAASDAAGAAASAVQSMAGKIQELSSTPLNIQVKVGVDTYRIDNSNPYAIEHASGGIFIGPTLIPSINGRNHLVGEAGAEAITPLHAGPDTLKKMDAKLDALLSGGRPVQHVINLDGRQIASATLPYVDAHVAGKASRGALTRRTVF